MGRGRIVHLVGGHLDEQAAELFRGALIDVVGAAFRIDVAIPCQDLHALFLGAIEGFAQPVGRQSGDRDGVVALVDEVVDELDLTGHGGFRGAVILDVDAELLAHRQSARTTGLEEADAGELGNEGDPGVGGAGRQGRGGESHRRDSKTNREFS